MDKTGTIEDLFKTESDFDLQQGVLQLNNRSRMGLIEAMNALKASSTRPAGNQEWSPRTMDWLRNQYGIDAETEEEAQEQIAILKELGAGKTAGQRAMEGAKAGADLGSKLAQLLPEKSETVVAPARGFGVVSRR